MFDKQNGIPMSAIIRTAVLTTLTVFFFGCGDDTGLDGGSNTSSPVGFGQNCNGNADCQTGLCHPESLRCTATCMDSAQCGPGVTCESGLCRFAQNMGTGGNAGTPGTGGTGGTAGSGTGGSAGTAGNMGNMGTGGTSGTPATASDIYTVKSGNLADDTPVTVEGVVTALRLNEEGLYSHLVIQIPADHSSYRGTDNSGLWVYLNNADDERLRTMPPMAGSLVRITGQVNNFYDQMQLQHVERLETLGQAQVPEAILVTAADVATGGPRAAALEGALVTVQDVEVTEVEPTAGPGDGMDGMATYEFVVDGQLRVDDYFYRSNPLPSVGTRFSRITGILRLGNAHSKMEPRSASDLQ
jgi:hypothetical protein